MSLPECVQAGATKSVGCTRVDVTLPTPVLPLWNRTAHRKKEKGPRARLLQGWDGVLRVNASKQLTYPKGRFLSGVRIETCIETSKLFIENINISSWGSGIDSSLKIKPICKREESKSMSMAPGRSKIPLLSTAYSQHLPETHGTSLLQFAPVHPLMRLAAKLPSRRMKRLPRLLHPVGASFLRP